MLDQSKRLLDVPLDTHDNMMKFIEGLPTDTCHLAMNMSEGTQREKREVIGRNFAKKLALIRRSAFKNGNGVDDGTEGKAATEEEEDDDVDEVEEEVDEVEAEKALRQKLVDLIESIPELFELVENETEILKLVLDQELQKYNLLLETMTDTLMDAVRAMDGQCLVTDTITDLLEAIEGDEIPDAWKASN